MILFVVCILLLAIFVFQVYSMIHFNEYKGRVEKLQKIVDKQKSDTRALLTAYMTESRVISFYDDITPLLKDQEVIDLFEKLAKDEEKHIQLLEKCMANK